MRGWLFGAGSAGYIPSKAPDAHESIGRSLRVLPVGDVNGLKDGSTPFFMVCGLGCTGLRTRNARHSICRHAGTGGWCQHTLWEKVTRLDESAVLSLGEHSAGLTPRVLEACNKASGQFEE